MRDYEHYALDPIGKYRRHPANAVWGEDGYDRFLRSFPGDHAELVEDLLAQNPYLSTPLPAELENALDQLVERFRTGKVPPRDAWAGWWLQPREFARAMIRTEWDVVFQRAQSEDRKATRNTQSDRGKASTYSERERPSGIRNAPGLAERALQDQIEAYLSTLEGLDWRDVSKIGLRGYPDIQARIHDQALFFEVKTPAGRVQPHQERWHESMRLTGAIVEVVRSIDDVKRVLTQLVSDPIGGTE